MIVVGIDPSLTGTGIGVVDTDDHLVIETRTITTKPSGTGLTDRLTRMRRIVHEADRHILMLECDDDAKADLIVIESPSLGQARHAQGGQLDRHGLWWMLVDRAHTLGVPVAAVTPAARAKYATGRGNSAKDAVLLAVARRWPQAPVTNNNEADAVVLACMGADAYVGPVGAVPRVNQDALSKVVWPVLPGEEVA